MALDSRRPPSKAVAPPCDPAKNTMEKLPVELLQNILQLCIDERSKNFVLNLRLVCKAFDLILKPYGCKNIYLDLCRLSKWDRKLLPRKEALRTIGYHCKSLYIDLINLRDEGEVELLDSLLDQNPNRRAFCSNLRQKFCMNPTSFTELEFYDTVGEILLNCRGIRRLALNLPCQLLGSHGTASTRVMANTLKALASWACDDEEPVILDTLMLENVTDSVLCSLWSNPIDIQSVKSVLVRVEHIIISLRLHVLEPLEYEQFPRALWDFLSRAQMLKSCCIRDNDPPEPPQRVRVTMASNMTHFAFNARSLPNSLPYRLFLTSLELKNTEFTGTAFEALTMTVGSTLQELFLNNIYLKVTKDEFASAPDDPLWVGLPNCRPGHRRWMASLVRQNLPHLRVCRASCLGYDLYASEAVDSVQPAFDLRDPCGLSRTLEQRFVEVVTGIRQPSRDGEVIEYLLPSPLPNSPPMSDKGLRPRTGPLAVEEYDTNAYQYAVANPTSAWHNCLDGIFPNVNAMSRYSLRWIAETACRGMNEVDAQRWAQRRAGLDHEPEPTDEFGRARAH